MQIRSIKVPDELLRAASNQQLVVFVGAGASRDAPSNLPDFSRLIKRIGRQVDSRPSAQDLRRPDAYLGRLEAEGTDVHALVREAIDLRGSEPNRVHHAVINFAHAHGPLRVVTTNYDRHLTTTSAAIAPETVVHLAPALPMGDDFTGIVHLHGALTQEPRHLIVTDSDFGRAYLRDSWASRFLERMFASFTVLFIGYSHGDIVMQYLARSLNPERRYVLTHEADRSEWRSLGLTPVVYESDGKSHQALPEALERWTELTVMGRTGHRSLVAEIVAAGRPPTIPEELDYLEESIRHPERVRYFTEAAREPQWLTWASGRPEFTALFAGDSQVEEAVGSELVSWVVDHYAMNPDHAPQALRLLSDRAWSPATWQTIAHRLFARVDALPPILTPWIGLVLDQAKPGSSDGLDLLLAESGWEDYPDVALLLWEHRTRPTLKAGISWGEADQLPTFEVDVAAEEHWIGESWTKSFEPRLDQFAAPLLAITANNLEAAYRLHRAANPGITYGPYRFARTAIESRDSGFTEAVDVVIDAMRTCLEHQLSNAPAVAAGFLDQWLQSDAGILRRLAVHGWRLRTDRTPEEKLAATSTVAFLYDADVRHEVRLLLKEILPQVTAAQVDGVIDRALEGPPHERGAEGDADASMALLAQLYLLDDLAASLPQITALSAALADRQQEHPEFRPRGAQDAGDVRRVAYAEREPFTAEQLHDLIVADPDLALSRVSEAQNSSALFAGPTWSGALAVVRRCVADHPADGVLLSSLLDSPPGRTGEQLREAIIQGWSDAAIDDVLAAQILDDLSQLDPQHIRAATASMLARPAHTDTATAWHRLSAARTLALRLWPDHEIRGAITGGTDLLTEAINHPAGNLAEFWTLAVQADWRATGSAHAGIEGATRDGLQQIASDAGRAGVLGRAALISQLRFYMRADADWTKRNLLPLLDWKRTPAEAPQAWSVFLGYGRPDDGLLEAGLLTQYLTTAARLDELRQDRAEWKLGEHFAQIALFSAIAPRTWLNRFVRNSTETLRVAWVRRVAHHLKNMEPDQAAVHWKRWIQQYWTNRARSVPARLSALEGAAMAHWIIHLPQHRTEAAALFMRGEAALSQHDSLLHTLSKTDLTADAEAWAGVVEHLLAGTRQPDPTTGYSLRTIVPALRSAAPHLDLSRLVEHAMRLGCTNAPEW